MTSIIILFFWLISITLTEKTAYEAAIMARDIISRAKASGELGSTMINIYGLSGNKLIH